jgi:hypothetical protein
MAKSSDIFHILMHDRAPVYFFIIDFFGVVFDGVTFDFVSALNAFFLFLGAFYIFFIVLILFKNKIIASISSFLYLISPILFIFSLTEDYTNPALFFSLQALFFACLYKYKGDKSYIWISIFSAILTLGARPEYIIFIALYLLFLFFFISNARKIHYASFIALSIPKFVIAVNMYTNEGRFIHGNIFDHPNLTFWHWLQHNFSSNLLGNLQGDMHALFDPATLMGVLMVLGLWGAALVIFYYKKYLKAILYFAILFFVFAFYYCFFHGEGLDGGFKYISSLILPLIVLSAISLYEIYTRARYLFWAIIVLMAGYSLHITSPVTYNMDIPHPIRDSYDHHFKGYFENPLNITKEYKRYKELNYKTRYSWGDETQEADIDLTRNNVFLTNGIRTYLSAAPVNKEVRSFLDIDSLRRELSSLKDFSGDIYAAQGALGFTAANKNIFSEFHGVHPKEFEQILLDNFVLEKEIISYYEGEHHVFLYKLSSP